MPHITNAAEIGRRGLKKQQYLLVTLKLFTKIIDSIVHVAKFQEGKECDGGGQYHFSDLFFLDRSVHELWYSGDH